MKISQAHTISGIPHQIPSHLTTAQEKMTDCFVWALPSYLGI